jgi:hypothetical protein
MIWQKTGSLFLGSDLALRFLSFLGLLDNPLIGEIIFIDIGDVLHRLTTDFLRYNEAPRC